MAIHGLTHDVDTGIVLNDSDYAGKINIGWAPGEGPNKSNAPMNAGHFIIMKSVSVAVPMTNGDSSYTQKWVQDNVMQSLLCGSEEDQNTNYKLCRDSKGVVKPKFLEFVILHNTIDEFYTSELAKYSSTHRRMCHSQGEGTTAVETVINGTSVSYKPRIQEINGITYDTCPYRACPDYSCKACGEHATLKVFPKINIAINPYKISLQSVVSIAQIEKMLQKVWNLLHLAHKIRQASSSEKMPFEGFFGTTMVMTVTQETIKDKKHWIMKMYPSKATNVYVMAPVRQIVERNQKAMLSGGDVVPMISAAGANAQTLQLGAIDDIDIDVENIGMLAIEDGTDTPVVSQVSAAESAADLMDE